MPRQIKPRYSGPATGNIVQPVKFTKKQIAELKDIFKRAKIPDEKLDAVLSGLAECCALGRDVYHEMQNDPSAREVKAALKNIEKSAADLAKGISNADPVTRSRLKNISHVELGHYERIEVMAEELQTISIAAKSEIKKISNTFGKRSPTFFVTLIHDCLKCNDIVLKVSRSSDSLFCKVCNVCFSAAGIHSGAQHAITRYQKETKG